MPSNWRSLKKSVNINGLKISYVEMGIGRPIIFQHGNPTSSYLWRKIVPKISQLGRCIAIDLVGMGDSDKISQVDPSSYTLKDHKYYWRETLRALGVKKISYLCFMIGGVLLDLIILRSIQIQLMEFAIWRPYMIKWNGMTGQKVQENFSRFERR